ncbi:hypothetical protein HYPDE_29233 [Hyphomicrobium denitrificans 1NES1]|uniref:Nucleotide-diphospho-sugar transferase domain-containing protein n=1 Tax=Hyphomicrobium denitrificans 1NES1 TaxID=670307 RepID=N0B5P8_9HYPH|nr:hypothetical protein [Hyphomicrobium denitrificans]AGK57522.1 hypothetical protein HYPDE_29233 [Hyphomicrobium denitrificans 1NES1]
MQDFISVPRTDDKPIVVGFFTPNYKPIADRFVANLARIGISHHIFAVSGHDWKSATLLKPEIIAGARSLYPRAPIVFMDVDCIIRGPVHPLFEMISGTDVALPIRIIQSDKRDLVWSSSRIIVWNPTDGAARLLKRWIELCSERSSMHVKLNDEKLLLRAISQSGGVTFTQIPAQYAAFEITDIGPEAVIVHQTTRPPRPLSLAKRLKHAMIKSLTGKPYAEWKYGIKN